MIVRKRLWYYLRIDFPLVDDLEYHDILFARSHTTFRKGAGTFSDVTPEADHPSWTNFMVDTFDYLDTAHTYFLRLRRDLVISWWIFQESMKNCSIIEDIRNTRNFVKIVLGSLRSSSIVVTPIDFSDIDLSPSSVSDLKRVKREVSSCIFD